MKGFSCLAQVAEGRKAVVEALEKVEAAQAEVSCASLLMLCRLD